MGERYLLIAREGENGRTIPESSISQEVHLQEAFKNHPELIPVGDLGLGPLLVIGRETTVKSGGAVDLLSVDPKGHVVVAEFKRGPENSDSRRVIAQLLKYASRLWGLSYEDLDGMAQQYFKSKRCAGARVRGAQSLSVAAAAYWSNEEEFSFEDFREGIVNTLADGVLDCIVISSEIDENTLKVIEFLNATARFRSYAIEIDHFSDDERSVFVPRVVALPSGRKRSTVPRERTTRANFLAACSESARGFFAKLLDFMETSSGGISWGTKGFGFGIPVGGEWPRILYGFPRGSVGHNLDYAQLVTSDLRNRGVPEEVLKEYAGAVAGLSIFSRTGIGNITFDVDEKADEKAANVLIAAMQRLITEVAQRV